MFDLLEAPVIPLALCFLEEQPAVPQRFVEALDAQPQQAGPQHLPRLDRVEDRLP